MAAAAAGLRATTPAEREYGLDWLRVFAFTILILYHSGMIFVTWDFHIKNAETSRVLEWVMLFVNRWRLPLLFFISGAAVCFSLRRRSFGQFAMERLRRLLVPVVFAMFVIIPPQIYFERLQDGVAFASYAEFYKTVFELEPYPKGSFSWHHLWFVVYILIYSLACIPLFAALKRGAGKRLIARLATFLERRPAAVYLISIPSLAVGIGLGPYWPTTHNLVADWANLLGSLITFLWGFVFASELRLLDLLTRRRREFLIGGIAMAVVFFAMRASGVARDWPRVAQIVIGNVVSGYFGMFWIFALAGYARAKVRTGGPALRYATEAVYPFYILHQTVTIALGYYVVQWAMPVALKFAIVAAGTFAGTWLLYEAARRVPPLRPLLGMRAAR